MVGLWALPALRGTEQRQSCAPYCLFVCLYLGKEIHSGKLQLKMHYQEKNFLDDSQNQEEGGRSSLGREEGPEAPRTRGDGSF